jgi:hypothetical protein
MGALSLVMVAPLLMLLTSFCRFCSPIGDHIPHVSGNIGWENGMIFWEESSILWLNL